MPLDVLLPIILVPILFAGGLAWYRRVLGRIQPDAVERELRGTRLTGEQLRRLPSPPWRIVHEIGEGHLGDIDHVAIGPAGVVALTTVLSDRPTEDVDTDPVVVAAAAVRRGPVDDLLEPLGLRCDRLASVFWGAADPDRPAAVEVTHGAVAVVGQRLDEWLAALPADVLTADQVERAWVAVATGIGRPDPTARGRAGDE